MKNPARDQGNGTRAGRNPRGSLNFAASTPPPILIFVPNYPTPLFGSKILTSLSHRQGNDGVREDYWWARVAARRRALRSRAMLRRSRRASCWRRRNSGSAEVS